MTHWIASSTV